MTNELDDRLMLSDLLADLGGIAADRVFLRPMPGTATEADLIAKVDGDHKTLCELIDGTLVEKAMGSRESGLNVEMIGILREWVRKHNLGVLLGSDGMVRLFAGRVRMPDTSFIAWGRLPGRRWPKAAIWDVAPNLAVEVLSDGNTPREMELKRGDYFKSGVELVWEIDPEARTVDVYTSEDSHTRLNEADTLGGGAVLPGFSLALADLFGELDQQG